MSCVQGCKSEHRHRKGFNTDGSINLRTQADVMYHVTSLQLAALSLSVLVFLDVHDVLVIQEVKTAKVMGGNYLFLLGYLHIKSAYTL